MKKSTQLDEGAVFVSETLSHELIFADQQFSLMAQTEGAANAFRHYLKSDAIQLPNGQRARHGGKLIAESMKSGVLSFTWQPVGGVIAQSNDLGYTWGLYNVVVGTDLTAEMQISGYYLSIWSRDEKGEWKVSMDIGNELEKFNIGESSHA
ncbi:MAG TPA: hypothetical protein VF857_10070 [Spirochaetota bacterium]